MSDPYGRGCSVELHVTIIVAWAKLSVLAKLSNEAVKCRKRDAVQQADHDM